MTYTDKLNKETLSKCGVNNPLHQKILLDDLPCGIETAKEVLNDSTLIQVNAPRVLMVCVWKGMVAAFVKLEIQQKEA